MATKVKLFGLNLAPLFRAIAQVESDRGRTSSNTYQIRRIYYDDVVRISAIRGHQIPPAYRVCIGDDNFAEALMVAYWSYYGEIHQICRGRRITYEYLARIHNGGPDGWKKDATLGYWNKVKKVMESEVGK